MGGDTSATDYIYAGIGTQIASGVTKAVTGLRRSGIYAESQKANALALRQDAAYQEQAIETETKQRQAETRRLVGRQIAKYAAAGVSVSSQTARNVYSTTYQQSQKDIEIYNLQRRFKISNDLYAAEMEEWKGKAGQMQGYLGAGQTLLSTAGQSLLTMSKYGV